MVQETPFIFASPRHFSFTLLSMYLKGQSHIYIYNIICIVYIANIIHIYIYVYVNKNMSIFTYTYIYIYIHYTYFHFRPIHTYPKLYSYITNHYFVCLQKCTPGPPRCQRDKSADSCAQRSTHLKCWSRCPVPSQLGSKHMENGTIFNRYTVYTLKNSTWILERMLWKRFGVYRIKLFLLFFEGPLKKSIMMRYCWICHLFHHPKNSATILDSYIHHPWCHDPKHCDLAYNPLTWNTRLG